VPTAGKGGTASAGAVGLGSRPPRRRWVRPGEHAAGLGVHGTPVPLHPENLWIKDVTVMPLARTGRRITA